MPGAAKLPLLFAPDNPPPPYPGISPLQQMASRIARNREVIGLHFPSDSKAGRVLAQQSFYLLMQCKSIKFDPAHPLDSLIGRARAEWWP